MSRSLIPKGGNDKVYTPDDLAIKIVRHFKNQIKGRVLEPCAGGGAFVRAFQHEGIKHVELELERGLDFFEWHGKTDWIITNPPWSKARDFARHAYTVAHDVVFLITINHFTSLKARFRDMEEAGFMIREVVLINTPPEPWPQSGFQLGAVHIQKGWKGKFGFTRL